VVLSVIAGVLIALTVLAAIRLLLRQGQAQELAVGATITEETAAPVGAWIAVGVLAALALTVSYFAWGRPQGPPRIQPPRMPPAAEAPKTPGLSPARPQAGRSSRNSLQGFLDWLRPRPRPPAPPKNRETPESDTPETPPASDGKPESAQDGAQPPPVIPVPPQAVPPPPVETPTGGLISDPVWIQRPELDDIARFYPEAAKGHAGAAIIECQVTRMGRLRGCTLVLENPTGQGFGQAALRLAYRFRMRETSRSGEPTFGRTVRVPIAFIPSS
jgi:protein TonB